MTASASAVLPAAVADRDESRRVVAPVGATLNGRFPARAVPGHWPAAGADRSQVLELVTSLSVSPGSSGRQAVNRRRRGLALLLDWLEEQPGDSWQQRWLASGADSAGADWAQGPARWLQHLNRHSPARLELMTSSLLVMVGADVVRPSLGWLLTGGTTRKLAGNVIRARDPKGFERLATLCDSDAGISAHARSNTLFRCAVIIAAKGGTLADITIGDVLEILNAEADLRGRTASGSASFALLRELGIFGPGVPTLGELRSVGQRPVEQLVDRYPIAYRPVRDLLVDYLKERQPAIDYSTLRNQSSALAKYFWADLEAHHSGIDTLRLPAEVANAWKLRLQTRTTTTTAAGGAGGTLNVTVERLSYLDTLATVRAFYLDVSQWALDDPARWGAWVAPCPVGHDDLTRRKARRRRKARMDARTRERLPVLPVLVRAASQRRSDSAALLDAARKAAPGAEFTAAGRTLVRSLRPHAAPTNTWASDPATGTQHLLDRDEDHAFWSWAVIEVLRLTGVRVEELLELSHYSLVQYRLPTTAELVPLLQIAPSKTDTERLLLVSPELADVLSAIIRRVRDSSGTVPLVRARDHREHLWQPPSPLLFQRRHGGEHHAPSIAWVARLLDEALAHTGLADQSGATLHYTPHDFRRMFITDAILNGLPPHIAQIIAGHRDINVTMGYNAVYPEHAIQAHLAFLARRRALRPTEEYRTPSDEEWEQFLGHFQRRKVSIGTCARAIQTACIHEHACVRCSMLWPDPAQRSRVVEIRDNLKDRIAEAHREGWIGEAEGLEVSLAGAEDKLTQIDRRHPPSSVPVAMPVNRGAGKPTNGQQTLN